MNDHHAKDAHYHDAIAREYDAIVVDPRRVPNDILFEPIVRHVRAGQALLDLGCGTGQMLRRLRSRFHNATGVDHSAGMLEQAQRNLAADGLAQAQLIRSDVRAYVRTCDERFDCVSCVGVLHHLEPAELAELLRGVRGLMRDRDSVVVLAEPVGVDPAAMPAAVQDWNRHSLATRLAYSRNDVAEPDEAPLSESAFRAHLAAAGLQVIAESRMWEMASLSEHPGWIERWRTRRLIRRHGAGGNVLALALTACV
jgi:predicted TPR repeat methyltransferase